MQNYSTTELLKISTKTLHAKTEQALNAKAIFSTDFSIEQSKFLLYKLYHAYSEIEQNVALHIDAPFVKYYYSKFYNSKSELLYNDLTHQGVNAPVIQSKSFISNPLKAVGALYVLKGSDAGGEHIYKQIQLKSFNWPQHSTMFYQEAAKSHYNWNEFKNDINQREFSNNEKADLIEGASIAFKRIITIANNNKIHP